MVLIFSSISKDADRNCIAEKEVEMTGCEVRPLVDVEEGLIECL